MPLIRDTAKLRFCKNCKDPFHPTMLDWVFCEDKCRQLWVTKWLKQPDSPVKATA
jgi:hypothetical protein